jgi:ankyrin repeat protein
MLSIWNIVLSWGFIMLSRLGSFFVECSQYLLVLPALLKKYAINFITIIFSYVRFFLGIILWVVIGYVIYHFIDFTLFEKVALVLLGLITYSMLFLANKDDIEEFILVNKHTLEEHKEEYTRQLHAQVILLKNIINAQKKLFATTPLHDAISDGDVEKVKTLLENGTDFNEITLDGLTPLLCIGSSEYRWNRNKKLGRDYWLSSRMDGDNFYEIAKILIECGADVNALNPDGTNLLDDAVRDINLKLVTLLIEKGIDVSVRSYYDDNSYLHTISQPSCFSCDSCSDSTCMRLVVAKMLIDNDKHLVNANDIHGRTPLHDAVIFDRIEIVKLLIAHDVKINVKDSDGKTPLDMIFGRYDWSENRDAIEVLLKNHGAKRGFEISDECSL